MSRVILITGMHRSGTSLVSSLIQRAGIHIGDKLLAGNAANPRGFSNPDELVEGGQLMMMRIPLPVATDKDQCKQSGWDSIFRGSGGVFRNQGDCIQYVNTGK